MRAFDTLFPAAVIAAIAGMVTPSRVHAGPFDGVAGAAVGFALGAMVAGAARPAPAYAARRPRRVVYRTRRPAAPRYASGPSRQRPGGAAISTVSDPFASSGGARPIPVSGR